MKYKAGDWIYINHHEVRLNGLPSRFHGKVYEILAVDSDLYKEYKINDGETLTGGWWAHESVIRLATELEKALT